MTTPSIDLSSVPSSFIQPPPCSPFPHILRIKHSRSGFCARNTCAFPFVSLRKRGKNVDMVRQRNLLHSSKISFFACRPFAILSITIGLSLSSCWNLISEPLYNFMPISSWRRIISPIGSCGCFFTPLSTRGYICFNVSITLPLAKKSDTLRMKQTIFALSFMARYSIGA